MARPDRILSSAQVRNAKPKGKRRGILLCDGGGLYLQVTTGDDGNIRRSWIFRYQLKGRRKRDMGLGPSKDFGLGDARDAATEYRKLLKQGIDPIAHRDAKVARNLAANASIVTFDQAAESYIRQHRAGWKSPIHAAQWSSTLKTYASPILGKLPVADISTAHVMKALDPIWHVKPETASRVRGRIEAVMGWAGASGFRKGQKGEDMPNPARWKDHLDQLLPAPRKVRKVEHQKALPYVEMPTFMKELRAREGIAALALEFTVLTCVRTADVRRAKWADIDLKARVWTIPEFSKTHREHRVPLSDAALAAIDKVRVIVSAIDGTVGQSKYLFPNDRSGAALSENAMLAVLDRMGRKGQMTTHGCRATFRTWAQERTNFPRELAEMSLGHTVESAVERAYLRGDAIAKRHAIMQAWANFCREPVGTAKIIGMQNLKA